MASHSQRTSPTIDVASILLLALPVVAAFGVFVMNLDTPAALLTLAILGTSLTLIELLRLHSDPDLPGPGVLLFHLGMLFWFYAPALVTALSDTQWNQSATHVSISNSDAAETFVLVALFHYVFTLTYRVWAARSPQQQRSPRAGERINPHRLAMGVLMTAGVAIGFYAIESGGLLQAIDYVLVSRSKEKPWSSAGIYGTSLTPYHYVAQAMLVCSAVVAMSLVLFKKISGLYRWLMIAVAVFCVGWVSIDSGTRSTLLLAALPAFIPYYFTARGRYRGTAPRSRVWRYLVLGLVALVVVVGADVQRYYRQTGVLNEPAAVRIEDNDFFTYTAFAVGVQEEQESFAGDNPVFELAAGPIPRALWPDKPEPESVILFSRYMRGQDIRVTGGNVLPSIVGQMYLSQGIAGILLAAVLLGIALAYGDRLYADRGLTTKVLYALFVVFVFVSFRAIGFGYFSSFLLLWGAVIARRLLVSVFGKTLAPLDQTGPAAEPA